MAGKLEHKILPFTISELEEKQNEAGLNVITVTGHAAYKNNVDLGGDRIIDGAFKAGLRQNKGKWPVQLDHDHRISATAGENVSAKEDAEGLLTSFEILLDSDSGKDAAVKMRHAKSVGRPMGLSIGYRAPAWEYVKDKNGESVRELKEILVFEHSLTNFPMNPKAMVESIKSICDGGDKEAIAQKKRDLEQVLRDEGCSRKEAEVAVSAMFAMRDASNAEDEAKAKIEQAGADVFSSLSKLIKTGD